MQRITAAERRSRLVRRHHLARATLATNVAQATRDLVALHATDPASVYLALRARVKNTTVQAIEKALYEERSVIRMLGMRRTVFVVPTDEIHVVQAACTDDIAPRERRRLVELLTASGVKLADRWLGEVERSVLRLLDEKGDLTGSQIASLEPRLRLKLSDPRFTRYGPPVTITTYVLTLLAAKGVIVRGRPRGSWASGQHAWSPVRRWVPHPPPAVDAIAARRHLARRWLRTFGPATAEDLKWWAGWTVAATRQALEGITRDVDLDGAPGIVLEDDLGRTRPVAPSAVFLPGLDPTLMGWARRDWYLGTHAAQLFDRSGNGGPTVWRDGRVIGGWLQRKDGAVAYRLLEDVGHAAKVEADEEAHRVQAWIGAVRVTPRFRTPLEMELSR